MKSRIKRILVANRGEIARRIMRTCRHFGIETVAIYSDADADAPHVREADAAVRIGPPPATESYLNVEKILDAARLAGADAVHPGYGFLAENADFARACQERGITFIGPSPDVIRLLGSKRESKRVVAEAGVAVIPGHNSDAQDTSSLAAAAAEVGFPVLLKASAGGGGKGMRVVHDRKGIEEAIESAKRESMSAFGDDTLLVEKYIDNPRHVEFQILGDLHGNVVHLFERECSIQRRHQKIIEETPSPALDAELRAQMGEAALKVARAVGYTNAGTVELILAPDRSFYFLEVNTRLQVEHPVTEMVTGLDLVYHQIRVAEGEPLSLRQDDLSQQGAAIECRLYAEDPANEFLPASGMVVDWHGTETPSLRIDAALDGPAQVSIYYDPMLAKVVAHAPSRSEAIRKLIYGLRKLSVQGIVTNRDFLIRVLEHPDFVEGSFDTHFVDQRPELRNDTHGTPELLLEAAIAATLAEHEKRRTRRTVLPQLETGYRNNRFQDERAEYSSDSGHCAVLYRNVGGGRFVVRREGDDAESSSTLSSVRLCGHALTFERENGLLCTYRVVQDGKQHFVHGRAGSIALTLVPRFPEGKADVVAGACVAPMPGSVVKILIAEGEEVREGQTLLVLEAMKMEHAVTAPEDGVVRQLCVNEGQQVDAQELLVVVG